LADNDSPWEWENTDRPGLVPVATDTMRILVIVCHHLRVHGWAERTFDS